MEKPKVIFQDKDLYLDGFVISLPNIKEKKTFRRDLLISNSYDIPVRNYKNEFSVNNPDSLFYNSKWQYSDITIYGSNGLIVWEGIVIDIKRDHESRTAIIKTKSKFYQLANRKISYTSAAWETAATAFRNICIQEGFEKYNQRAVVDSENILTVNNCYIKCSFDLEDNINFLEVIQKLGDYSNSDVYSRGLEIYFQHWKPFSGGVSVFLNTETRIQGQKIKTLPAVQADLSILVNDFSIGYNGDSGTPATDLNSNNIGNLSRDNFGSISIPEMASSEDAQIIFKDKISAVYIGESYIKKSNSNLTTNPRALDKIIFDLYLDHKDYINLTTFLKLTFPAEGWTNKIFELFEYNIDENNDNINCVAYEVN